ncbi:MAG TPA: hypothetical protein VGG73_08110 [Vicinamibacterales bacterium]|jgi:hypothetical protein
MRQQFSSLFQIALVLIAASSSAGAQTAGPAGHWEGVIHMGKQEVAVAVDLARGAGDAWVGSMAIPGPAPVEVPVHNIVVNATGIRFKAGLPDNPVFDGMFGPDPSHLSGEASNQHGAVPFQLERKGDPHVKVPPPSSVLTKSFEGVWQGVADAGGKARKVVLKVTAAADGTATAVLITGDPDAGSSQEIPVTTVTLRDLQLQLDVPGAPGSYRGTLGAGGEIHGQWTEGTVNIPLNFKHAPEVK